MNTEVKEIETYQTFVVPLYNTNFTGKLELTVRNDSVTPNNKKNNQGMIWMTKNQKRI